MEDLVWATMDNEDWAREEIAQYERANQLIIRKNHAKSGNQAHQFNQILNFLIFCSFRENDKNGTYILLSLAFYARCVPSAPIINRLPVEKKAASTHTHTHRRSEK